MAVFSFVGGHGTAAAVGGIYAKMGIEDAAGLGVVLSTIGLIAAICGGLLLINVGARLGWTKYVSAEQVARRVKETGGATALPEDKREPIGYARVANDGVNNLLFQLAMVLGVLTAIVGVAGAALSARAGKASRRAVAQDAAAAGRG